MTSTLWTSVGVNPERVSDFPWEILLPPVNYPITSFAHLARHLSHVPQLEAAFSDTYLRPGSKLEPNQTRTSMIDLSSLTNFLETHARDFGAGFEYLRVEFGRTKVIGPVGSFCNVHANMEGCAFLASLFPAFRRLYIRIYGTQTNDENIIQHFKWAIKQLRWCPDRCFRCFRYAEIEALNDS